MFVFVMVLYGLGLLALLGTVINGFAGMFLIGGSQAYRDVTCHGLLSIALMVAAGVTHLMFL